MRGGRNSRLVLETWLRLLVSQDEDAHQVPKWATSCGQTRSFSFTAISQNVRNE